MFLTAAWTFDSPLMFCEKLLLIPKFCWFPILQDSTSGTWRPPRYISHKTTTQLALLVVTHDLVHSVLLSCIYQPCDKIDKPSPALLGHPFLHVAIDIVDLNIALEIWTTDADYLSTVVCRSGKGHLLNAIKVNNINKWIEVSFQLQTQSFNFFFCMGQKPLGH